MGRKRKYSSLGLRLDEAATVQNAEDVLLYYPQAKQGMTRASLQSPQFDGMPKSPSTNNHVEDAIVNRLSDAEFVDQCWRTLEKIESARSRAIIKYTYLGPILPDKLIMDKPDVGIESGWYYESKRRALLAFATCWPPSPSELLVYV